MFETDDGSLRYAQDAGIYITGVEADVALDRRRLIGASVLETSPRVFLCFGQSNAANHGEGSYRAEQAVFCFNPMDSGFYTAADPLPGATGNGGSVWGRLGDLLIRAGYCRSVLITTIAFGGSYLAEWSHGGALSRRLIFTIQRMLRNKLAIDALLWWQGEAEANRTDMSGEVYKAEFLSMSEQIRRLGIDSPIFVARSTLCANDVHPYENRSEIRRAQAELISPGRRIFPGPDTDQIGMSGRFDGCHLNQVGLAAAAALWRDAILESL